MTSRSDMSLYVLADEYRQIMELASDPEADSESFDAALCALKGEFADKAVAVAQMARNLEGLQEQITQAMRIMAHRAETAKRRSESIRAYLLTQMEACGISKIESPLFRIGIRKNPPKVVVADDAVIPPDFLRHVPERWEPDRGMIAVALRQGETINGCRLEQSSRVDIR